MKLINLLKKPCSTFLWRLYEFYLYPYQHLADGDIGPVRFTAPYFPIRVPGGRWMAML